MLRGVTRPLAMRATAICRLNTGFSYIPSENAVTELDLQEAHPTMNTMKLTLTRQDEAIYKLQEVKSVMISTTSGYLGINPGSEYKISKLLPGPIKVEVTEGNFETYFASGGFAHMNNAGTVDINCVECLPLSCFSLANAEKELATANDAAKGGKTDAEKAIGEIQVEVLESLVATLKA